jgi:ElaB/YqjD/DUF883 family membrane-anchored ribosome-binding protein
MSTQPGSLDDDQARQAAADLHCDLHDMGQHVQEQLDEWGDAARHQAQELQQTLEARIREKPLSAVLIAAGVGLLIGILWRR